MTSNVKNEKENIYSLKGFDKVFKFTLAQTFKNKAYIISFVSFVIMMALMGPIQYFSAKSSSNAAKSVSDYKVSDPVAKKAIVADASGLGLGADDFKFDELGYKNIDVSVEDVMSQDTTFDSIADSLGKEDMIIIIAVAQTGYQVNVIRADESDIPSDEMDTVSGYVQAQISDIKIAKSGISDEDVQLVQKGVYTNGVMSETEYNSSVSNEMSKSKLFSVLMIYSIVIMIVSTMSASYIVASVTEEKTSKLVEGLLVSVRPMALLLGKICGMMVYIISILICGFTASKISNFAIKAAFGVDVTQGVSQFDFGALFEFGAVGLVLILVSVLIVYMAFGGFSGMMGSACTKTEDVQSATGTVMGLVMTGYFGAMFAAGFDHPIVNSLACIIPPFSFYTNTVYYLAGRITLPYFALSMAIQIIVVVVILVLCAKTYRRLILNDSTKPKLIEILRALKN